LSPVVTIARPGEAVGERAPDGAGVRAGPRPGGRARFQRYHDALIHRWCGTAALLGALLVPAFLLLDWFTLPAGPFGRFARVRAVLTGLLLLQLAVIRLTAPTRASFLHGYFFTLLLGGAFCWMTAQQGGFDSSYYAGLSLVIAANLFLPWRPRHAWLTSGAVILGYLVINAAYGGAFHVAALVNNLFFLGTTALIAIVTAGAKYRMVANEYAARVQQQEANARLERSRAQLKAARDALWGEMEVAKRIQMALLPEDRRLGAYQVAARMQPAAEVGGDYYDLVEAGEGRGWLAIGDVSGHGVEAGLVMMMTQTSILTLVRERPARSPAEVFSAVNGVLRENISRLHASRYMTLSVVRLEDAGLTLAGKHQDLLVWRRATREVDTIANEGCWIGVVDDAGPHVSDLFVPLSPGDVALFYTDGATEAMDGRGRMYGQERLARALSAVADRPLGAAVDAILADLAEFRAVQDDDVTLLLLRRAAGLSPAEPERHAAAAE
jgi:phosphoserine phosphatase RsbU/P